MPKLWNETIEAHRREVSEAIMDTAVELVAEHGLRQVTMSQIAEQVGIGRATLYKYFSSVDAILHAWHERQIGAHLKTLVEVRDRAGDVGERLEAVLETYARISHGSRGHHNTELAAFLHRDEQVQLAQEQVHDLIEDLLVACAKAGKIRTDVPPEELASYCLHALAAAGDMSSSAAVRRVAQVTFDGMRIRP